MGVEAVPGKWSEALRVEEVRQLISNGKLGDDIIGELKKIITKKIRVLPGTAGACTQAVNVNWAMTLWVGNKKSNMCLLVLP